MSMMKLVAGSWLLVAPKLEEAKKAAARLLSPLPSRPFSHPDCLLLSPHPHLGIGEVREATRFLATRPWEGNWKVVIFQAAEKLTLPAQNALLKTLEEPGERRYLLLLTTQPAALLPTVISRCHLLRLPGAPSLSPSGKQLLLLAGADLKQKLTTLRRLAPQKREELASWLEEASRGCQKLLLENPAPKTAQVIRLLEEARRMVEANLEPADIIDWLALRL